MRSFFIVIVAVLFLFAAFVGGWWFAEVVKQDPFLSKIMRVDNGQYDRFVRDITDVIQEVRIDDQNDWMEQLLSSPIAPVFAQQVEPHDSGGEEKAQDGEVDVDIATDDYVELPVEAIVAIEPNTMLEAIVQQMSTKEKLTFLYWARSRFSNEQLVQIEHLLQDGITTDNFLTLYQFTRKSLNGSDYEYLLSFIDRYLTTLQSPAHDDAVPVFQAKEGSTTRPN